MIKGFWADIIISIYLLTTLFLRILAEPGLEGHPIFSIAAGLVFISILWALIKIKVLVPNYFGLFKPKRKL